MRHFYIAVITASAATEQKINTKHEVTLQEVREAAVLTEVDARWEEDPDRGGRLLVVGTSYSGRVLNIVLYPVDVEDGTWELATAMPR